MFFYLDETRQTSSTVTSTYLFIYLTFISTSFIVNEGGEARDQQRTANWGSWSTVSGFESGAKWQDLSRLNTPGSFPK